MGPSSKRVQLFSILIRIYTFSAFKLMALLLEKATTSFGLDYRKLSVRTFILPGPSTYWARVWCTCCTPSRRPWSQYWQTLFVADKYSWRTWLHRWNEHTKIAEHYKHPYPWFTHQQSGEQKKTMHVCFLNICLLVKRIVEFYMYFWCVRSL